MSSSRFNSQGDVSRPPGDAVSSLLAATASQSTDQSGRPVPRKRKGHRGGKKKRSRRKSFAILHEESHDEIGEASGEGFYQLPTGNLSGTSIDSEALLDHR